MDNGEKKKTNNIMIKLKSLSQKDRREWVFQICSWMFFVLVFAGSFLFMKANIHKMIDSDLTAELMLGKMLASENKIITENWVYSTELKVINDNVIFALLFKFFSTYRQVRIASYIVFWALYLGAYYYFCKAFRIEKYYALSASMLLLPFSAWYFGLVTQGVYYIPYISLAFLAMGMYENYLQKNKMIYFIFLVILSFIAGIGGPRLLVVLSLPLAMVAITELSKKGIISAFSALAFATAGYLINSKVLALHYHFSSWEWMSFQNFSFDRLESIISGVFISFGLCTDHNIFDIKTIKTICCFCLIILTIISVYYGIKNRDKVSKTYKRLSLYISYSYLIFFGLYMFTDMAYSVHYTVPYAPWSFPIIIMFFMEVEIPEKYRTCFERMAIVLLTLLVLMSGIKFLRERREVDDNVEKRAIIAELLEGGYYNGYATYWNANVMTELSEEQITCWLWNQLESKVEADDVDVICPWLNPISCLTEKPSGKVFIILERSELAIFPLAERIEDYDIIYASDRYVVFGYDSYELMKEDFKE